jgi:hypothetical protein
MFEPMFVRGKLIWIASGVARVWVLNMCRLLPSKFGSVEEPVVVRGISHIIPRQKRVVADHEIRNENNGRLGLNCLLLSGCGCTSVSMLIGGSPESRHDSIRKVD